MTAPTPLLEFIDVSLHDPAYPDPLLMGLDASVGPGDGLVLTGPACSGKSTALGLVQGSGHETSGEILVLGHHPGSLNPSELTGLRTRIGSVPQYGALLSNLSLRDNLALPLRYHRHADDHQVEQALRVACDLVELDADSLPAVQPHQVSQEFRQLISLAKALVLEPAILLLDEPTARLSHKAALNFWQVLEKIRAQRQLALLITAHDDTLVRTVCSQRIALPARWLDLLPHQRPG